MGKRKLKTNENELPQKITKKINVGDDSVQPKKRKLTQQKVVVKKEDKTTIDNLTKLVNKVKRIKQKKINNALKQETKSVPSSQNNRDKKLEAKTKKRQKKNKSKAMCKKRKKNELSEQKKKLISSEQTIMAPEFLKKIEQMWEKFIDKSNQNKISENAEELHGVIKGLTKKLVYAKEMSKVFESLMSCASQTIIDSMYNELKDEIIKMSMSEHAKVFVLSVLRHGNDEQKNEVIDVVTKNIVWLIKDKEALSVVEEIYNEFANKEQSNLMIRSICNERNAKSLENDFFKLSFSKDILMELLKEPGISEKNVCKAVRTYFEGSGLGQFEVIDKVKDTVGRILYTEDGSYIAMQCIKLGSAETQKVIIESLTGYVARICKSSTGKFVLMTIFDCVDNVELIVKYIIKEIANDLEGIIPDKNGYVVLQYLLERESPYLNKEAAKLKKQMKSVDRHHLLARVVPVFAKFLADNPRLLLLGGHAVNFVRGLNRNIDDCWSINWDSLAKLAAEPYAGRQYSKPSFCHAVEVISSNQLLRTLLRYDKSFQGNSPCSENHELFCDKLMRFVEPNNFLKWTESRSGTYLLICLFEVGYKRIQDKLREILKPLHNELEESPFEDRQKLFKLLTETQEHH